MPGSVDSLDSRRNEVYYKNCYWLCSNGHKSVGTTLEAKLSLFVVINLCLFSFPKATKIDWLRYFSVLNEQRDNYAIAIFGRSQGLVQLVQLCNQLFRMSYFLHLMVSLLFLKIQGCSFWDSLLLFRKIKHGVNRILITFSVVKT